MDGTPPHRVPLDRGTWGAVGVFRYPAGYANGHAVDRQGRLVSCEQGDRRITRTEHDGSVTVLADSWDGKRLNSPNDIIERAGGSLWLTDPGLWHRQRLRGPPGRQ